jgi:hypothetical protein
MALDQASQLDRHRPCILGEQRDKLGDVVERY